jgi:hypothetical protein
LINGAARTTNPPRTLMPGRRTGTAWREATPLDRVLRSPAFRRFFAAARSASGGDSFNAVAIVILV